MTNFINPDVLISTHDITTLAFTDRSIQLNNDELGIGTSTCLLLCGEFEDEISGTTKESSFFDSVPPFYETCASKIPAKFPFHDQILKELAFLDPCNWNKSSIGGLIQLAAMFTSFTSDEIDTLFWNFVSIVPLLIATFLHLSPKQMMLLLTIFGQLCLK